MKYLRKKDLHMFQRRFQATKNMLNASMSIVVSTGYRILLLSFHLAVLSVVFPLVVFFRIWMIVRKVWLILYQKLIGYRC